MVSLVQRIDAHNDEMDDSSADKYCACKSCDVTVGELQNDLMEVAEIAQAKATHIRTKEAPTFEEFFKENAAYSEY